ncbi:MAG: LysR family transcriptional regulator [Albidovulum sp.]
MQIMDWDHLRVLLAVSRSGSFTGAARQLGVDDTTVSRRMRALHDQFGAKLLHRGADGALLLTPLGRQAADHAERMEDEMRRLTEAAGLGRGTVTGTVRLTAVPILANRLLAPQLGALFEAHPGLELDLVAENRNLNLTRRDADLALRLARPQTGGHTLWTRHLGDLGYGLYGAHSGAADAPLISYGEDRADLSPARWAEARLRAGAARRAAIRVSDAETALEAAAAGQGTALLPLTIADADPRLTALAMPDPPPARELWLIGHRDQRGMAHIRAVIDWLAGMVGPQAGASFR